MPRRNEMCQLARHPWRPPLATTNKHTESRLTIAAQCKAQADIVKSNCRPVLGRGGNGNLELARQEGELGMKR